MNKPDDLKQLIIEKVDFIRDIIRNTTVSVQYYKKIQIFSNVDLNACITSLNDLYTNTQNILDDLQSKPLELTINNLQKVIDRMSIIISGYGTKNIDDLIYITLGSDFNKSTIGDDLKSKYDLIKKYVHPVGFKLITDGKLVSAPDSLCIDKMTDENIKLENAPILECFECDATTSSHFYKINGIRITIRGSDNKLIIIYGIVDDVNLELLSNEYIHKRKFQINENKRNINEEVFTRHMEQLSLRDILIFGNQDIIKKYNCILSTVNIIKNENIEQTIKRFTKMDIIGRRNMLIYLLTYGVDSEIQYIAYLLYDIITVDSNENSDQITIFDSFPWKTKLLFKDTMKQTIKHTHMLTEKFDISKITLEQRIHLMRVPDNVKEKAMNKLKEIKNKTDDSGGKAKQYLEGLIKIPFNVLKEEPILRAIKDLNLKFTKNLVSIRSTFPDLNIPEKSSYTNLEIYQILNKIKNMMSIDPSIVSILQIETAIRYINANTCKSDKVAWSKYKNKLTRFNEIQKYFNSCDHEHRHSIFKIFNSKCATLYKETTQMINEIHLFKESMRDMEKTLDTSVFGHKTPKNQIIKIISQWISGELSGYCFGFEGSPGVGKTSLAKLGIANCLKDENGVARPFAFIAMGGSSNGSTLEGHGFTYVNASWGKILDVLMETKCLNPIFYFDEFDKISKSENGKEISGILTHLLDQTQNSEFEDKFYSGIKINLSKALIIVSYNDVSNIDKVLLDRIHRIQFDNLTSDDKLVIARDYIIPEINKKMGFENTVIISETILSVIINEYTSEPGVRKFKEIIFDLYGEINIELLKCDDLDRVIPIELTMEEVECKYLSKYKKIKDKKIGNVDCIGTINGMWANSMGKGGILQIETAYYPSNVFLELKLTGLQGDVMKESMNVAKSLAWSLCSDEIKSMITNNYSNKGIHVHASEGAVKKDGPSAGVAITTAIYSLFNNKSIAKDVALTGEIDLNGNVTAIGGLEYKITGSISAGIKKILYPTENSNDFAEIVKKIQIPRDVKFVEISNIKDVFEHVFI